MKNTLLTILRDQKTSAEEFRQAAHQLADLLAAEALSFVTEEPKTVQTSFAKAEGKFVPQRTVLIPILRAGLALLPAFLKYFPKAPIGFFGVKRDETTANPHLYYANIPPLHPTDLVFILDPMVATAGSSLLAIEHLLAMGLPPSRIVLVAIIGAVEGLQKIKKAYPHLPIVIATEDPELNNKKFIVPGLGDFGDRYFLT